MGSRWCHAARQHGDIPTQDYSVVVSPLLHYWISNQGLDQTDHRNQALFWSHLHTCKVFNIKTNMTQGRNMGGGHAPICRPLYLDHAPSLASTTHLLIFVTVSCTVVMLWRCHKSIHRQRHMKTYQSTQAHKVKTIPLDTVMAGNNCLCKLQIFDGRIGKTNN